MIRKTLIVITGLIIIAFSFLVPCGYAQESNQPSQRSAENLSLTLTIQSNKQVYEAGEEIGLTLEFKKSGTQNLWLFTKMLPNADLKLTVYRMDGDNRVDISPPILIDILRQIAADTDFKELLPQEVFPMQISLKDFQRELTLQKGSYEISLELNLPSYIFSHVSLTPWTGSIQSNTIAVEVREKAKEGADIRDQPDRELSEDELRMKEQLFALSRGEGDVADLRIEFMDGGMASGRFYWIAYAQIVGQEWDTPGSSLKHYNMFVTDEEVRSLLRQLVEHEYWTFQGTQFIPDAPGLMFRFHYKGLLSVEYRCDVHEYEPSAQLSAIRSVWLSFVSGASPQDQVSCEAQGGRFGKFGLMEKEQCNRPTTDAGKECSDHDECESDCVTEDSVPASTEVRGKCFEWTLMLGRCFNGVKDGKAQGLVCVD